MAILDETKGISKTEKKQWIATDMAEMILAPAYHA
jgi:hypothetical protein